jgi:hypothetical protein
MQPAPRRQRVAAGALAFAVADLVIGFTAFSSITLAALWVFALGWIQLHSEYVTHGLTFGVPWQLGLAWFGAIIALPMLAFTLYLASRALRLPRRVYYMVRGGIRPGPVSSPHRRNRSVGTRASATRPNYVAGFWMGAP